MIFLILSVCSVLSVWSSWYASYVWSAWYEWSVFETSTQSLALPDFKDKLKIDMKPNKIKHFSKGSKIGNMLMTRIRMDRSDLNLHKFVIGLSDNPICMCHAKQES